MHPEAYRAVLDMARQLKLNLPQDVDLVGLDIGGVDVNGSARGLLGAVHAWVGLDIEAGPGVDYVADATNWDQLKHLEGAFDVVLCTEVLEHVKSWPSIVRNAYRVLKPGGYLILTCAGRGRRPHGARGAARPAPGEHYANVEYDDLMTMLAQFPEHQGYWNPNPGDLYAWGRR